MLVQEIDTPALLVDLDAMESNLHRMAAFFEISPPSCDPISRITKSRCSHGNRLRRVRSVSLAPPYARPKSWYITGSAVFSSPTK